MKHIAPAAIIIYPLEMWKTRLSMNVHIHSKKIEKRENKKKVSKIFQCPTREWLFTDMPKRMRFIFKRKKISEHFHES